MIINQIVLNNLVYNEAYMRECLPHLKAGYFRTVGEQHVFGLIDEFVNEYGVAPTPEVLVVKLERSKLSESIYTEALQIVTEMEPSNDNLKWLRDETEAWAKDRALANAVRRAVRIYGGEEKDGDANMLPEMFQEALSVSFSEDMGHVYWEMASKQFDEMREEGIKVPFGADISYMNDITRGGVETKSLNIVLAGINTGKAQPLSSLILTPNGWVRMGDIKVGDMVYAVDGSITRVNGVFPQGVKLVNRITLWDGRQTRACDEHLWRMRKTRSGDKVVDTQELKRLLQLKKYASRNNRIYLDLPEPIQFGGVELPLDPWFVGYMIGNGCLTDSVMFSTQDQSVVERIRGYVGAFGCRVVHRGDYDYRISKNDQGVTNPVKDIMKEVGLWGHKSYTKSVPKMYLEGSVEQRLELLRGLMDSDGYVDNRGSMSFSTTSKQLALDVQYLVRSLGGMAKLSSGHGVLNGVAKAESFGVGVRLRSSINPFWVERKATRADMRQKPLDVVSVDSIVEDGYEECQCISVEHDSHLYVTDDFVVTHNTTWLIDRAMEQVELGKNVFYFTLEIQEKKIRHRADARILGMEFDRLEKMTKPEYLAAIEMKHRKATGQLFIKEYAPGTAHIGHFRHYITQIYRKYGIKPDMIIIDYITEAISSRLPIHMIGNTNTYFGSVAREFRTLGFEYEVPVWTAMQLQRDKQDGLGGKIGDVADAISIPKIADFMITIGREEADVLLKQCTVTQTKSRYDDKDKMRTFRLGLDNSRQKFFNCVGESLPDPTLSVADRIRQSEKRITTGNNPTLNEADSVLNWDFSQ